MHRPAASERSPAGVCSFALSRLLLCLSLTLALAGAAVRARAASIARLSVTESANRYRIAMRVELAVPAQGAYRVFANLANLRALNSDVRTAKIVGRGADGSVELYSVIHACVLWYCRSLRETQRMVFIASPNGGQAYATILPRTGSAFREGHAHWSFRGGADHTILRMTAQFEPAFRVPPIIGPWLVKRWLRRQVERTAKHIEQLSSRAATDPQAHSPSG